jgi:NAD(P)-dependent dehydrogenase (short-subunit alcohol dehydrogenase family)
MRLSGKVAIVTGAGSGIGRGVAEAFSREGARVAVIDQSLEAGEETVRMLRDDGREACFLHCDVTQESQVFEAVSKAFGAWGRIDVLYNNAGYAVRNTVEHEQEAEWDRCLSVNVKSAFLCSKQVIPMMRSYGGSIIHTSSVTGLTGVRNRAAYSAAKGALVSLTRNMAMDYAEAGIRVNCICPGFVVTPMLEPLFRDPDRAERLRSMHPLGRFGRVEDIAHAAVFLASDESAWMTGQCLTIDGGFSAGRFENV